MKVFWFIIITVLAVAIVQGMVCADSLDRPHFSLSSGGDSVYQHFSLHGIVPIGNWFVGIDWTHARNDGEQSSNDLRGRIEGTDHWDIFGYHAFARYGKRSTMAQERILQGGLALDLKLIHTDDVGFHVGLGTYAEHETLEEEYQAVIENASVAFAPRGHLNFRWKGLILQNEVYLHSDFKPYKTHSHFDIQLPLGKVLFFEEFSVSLTGGLEYNITTRHADIDRLQWHWAHQWRWGI